MRPSVVRKMIPRLTLVGAFLTLVGPELFACSGPGAARVMQQSQLIGWIFAGISIALVAGGCGLLRRRSLGHRIGWIVVPLVLHPRVWLDTGHGDCGYGLRWLSFVATLEIAIIVALAIWWPRASDSVQKKGRWALSGALAGALPGVLIASVLHDGPGSLTSTNLPLAGSVVCSLIVAGAIVGKSIYHFKTRKSSQVRFSFRTLLLMPVVLAPLCVALLPIQPYSASVSTLSPFHFLIIDDATGQPIPNAAVRLVDPRFRLDDSDNQGPQVATGPDGTAEYALFANIQGREGLLGRTETTSYDPWLIRVEAPAHRAFFTALASDTSVAPEPFTAPALGLTFPPPPSVTIHLVPIAGSTGENQKTAP